MEIKGGTIYLTKEGGAEIIKDFAEILYDMIEMAIEAQIKSKTPDTEMPFNIERIKKIRNLVGMYKYRQVKIGKYKVPPARTFGDIQREYENNLKETKKYMAKEKRNKNKKNKK